MLTEILLSICAVISLYLCYRYAVSRPEGFPPGPPRIPLFGSYLFMMLADKKYLHKGVLKFTKWYKSDIVGFHVGPFPTVAVHNAQGVREILNRREFDGRVPIFLAQMRAPEDELLGIFFREGPVWKEQRRFILRYLRDFGFGRRFAELELVIQEEITDLLDLIRNGPRYPHEHELSRPGGYRVCVPNVWSPFTYNAFFHIMMNERRPRSEQAEVLQLIKMGMQFQRKGDDYGKMLSIMPWIRHVFPSWSAYDVLTTANKFIFEFFEKIIDHHIDTYDENSERNFIDLYIKQMKMDHEQGQTDVYYRTQFILALVDFAFPAFTAIGVQFTFLIQYLLLYPDVLKRIQSEIDEVVDDGRLPTLEDRKHLHYTEAAIREGLRIETLVPSDVPHRALEDTELLGYKIPKHTIVIPSLYAYHADERVWGDPTKFRPERFLDENGKLSLKKDVSLPFGAGKRLCAGETFARNMLFLLTTAMCQNFNFILGPGDALPDLTKNNNGLIITPYDFWLQLEERK
ncbi:probable cytochrome P450 304a1 isoform X1 [Anastrepha ludens]|uniref:probable cytochrome P450 304a1 isoform X1 n=1 Tax=Anastrepha ludens TaxID=28586 RepID=UPI0023AFC2B9|nr:probable cytochrome P450 304a1 isoform X1 [Anastrepha ludens]